MPFFHVFVRFHKILTSFHQCRYIYVYNVEAQSEHSYHIRRKRTLSLKIGESAIGLFVTTANKKSYRTLIFEYMLSGSILN